MPTNPPTATSVDERATTRLPPAMNRMSVSLAGAGVLAAAAGAILLVFSIIETSWRIGDEASVFFTGLTLLVVGAGTAGFVAWRGPGALLGIGLAFFAGGASLFGSARVISAGLEAQDGRYWSATDVVALNSAALVLLVVGSASIATFAYAGHRRT